MLDAARHARVVPRFLTWALIALAVLAAPSPVRAARDLDAEMVELARQIQGTVKDRGNAIAVGEFHGPARLASTGGPAITKALTDQLEKLKVLVARTADLEVNGSFRDVVDRESKKTALQIKAVIEDRSGTAIVELSSRGIFDLTTIVALTGITLNTPPAAAEPEREERLDRALDKIQPPHLAGPRIAASAASPYAIEILVGPDPGDKKPDLSAYRPRAATLDREGLAVLKISRGEVYAVRVHNGSKLDVAVNLTIDGLSMFAFSEFKGYEVMFVPAGKSGIIAGWHRTNEASDTFQVSEYARSAAAQRLPGSSRAGTIEASFRAAWPKDARAPDDEPDFRPGGRDADATARGKPIEATYTEVTRNIGRFRESVSVRYNR